MTKKQVKKALNKKLQVKKLSCWNRGVILYAYDLLENISVNELPKDFTSLEDLLLRGDNNWQEYSWSGRTLVYSWDICHRLATPSFQKRKDYGRLNPSKNESWLDVQTRALRQACILIHYIVNNVS